MIALGPFGGHGGALDAARTAFPEATQPWIDLSTGINPVPYPLAALPSETWSRLPEASALADLERVAAARYGAARASDVVAAPGTQALIQHLPSVVPGRDVRVLGPTYGEYERVFRVAQARVRVVSAVDALAGADVAVVVNPNNPDGRLIAPSDLMRLASRVGRLVVDEAFIDAVAPAQSLVPQLPAGRALVLRSFGKIYGLAGLRLGFAVAPEDSASFRRLLGPWPVSGPAIAVGRRALADDAWLQTARGRLRTDAERLGFLLRGVGAESVGATSLFHLVRHPAASGLFRHLARNGILVRPFVEDSAKLRFGIPGSEAEWARLDKTLRAFD